VLVGLVLRRPRAGGVPQARLDGRPNQAPRPRSRF
jgi:hypothetical protein